MPPAPNGGEAVTPPSKPQSPLRITHDGEFYARLLTRESSLGIPSFRYYGAGSGAVPFVWELQPGTPKDAYSSGMLATGAVAPVITPPPSYHLRGAPHGHSARRHGKAGRSGGGGRSKYCGYKLSKWIKIGFIATVFRRLAFGKSRSLSSAASVKSSSSTRWLFSGSNVAEARDQEYCYEPAAPTKGMLCLGVRPSPWVQFWGGGRREPAGWVHG
ncbi:uncharacterized protein LOC133929837 [Phragmites australis]|uniref:uncharacterized protein LOC133929837 n=1 Tax=Phragmites australis TaxID=29695 RepID=UPI002D79151C|nr:uncharacterized protein LOC133929837 [Phragmites australis]